MIRVIIVGTGSMAREHVAAYSKIPDVQVVGGVDPNAEALAAFCATHDIPNAFNSVEAAVEWGGFDAASNVTPDQIHHRTTLPLLAAGKHVLCEKPLASNQTDAAEMANAAAKAGVINMVNLSYRNVPALEEAAKLVAAGEIGGVRHFEASYLQSWLTQSLWGDWREEAQWLWRLSSAHGSMGVLGDVGVHILDYVCHAIGANADHVSCRLKTFPKAPGDKIADYALDANDSMAMHLTLANGAMGVIHASRFASGHINDLSLRIYGTLGGLDVQFINFESSLKIAKGKDLQTGTWRPVAAPDIPSNYVRFLDAIRAGKPVQPDFAHGATLQRVLDLAVLSSQRNCADQSI
ncbi:Gfo/Idh/MocA family oxidoreductase [Yoonia sp. SS1-5]|uniref:Gfo/Idh/MocA family protein n=1 Tax=Yoonia rhodophyticola TaxID=3137370 RepID=A0AAN0ME57_9RHOB